MPKISFGKASYSPKLGEKYDNRIFKSRVDIQIVDLNHGLTKYLNIWQSLSMHTLQVFGARQPRLFADGRPFPKAGMRNWRMWCSNSPEAAAAAKESLRALPSDGRRRKQCEEKGGRKEGFVPRIMRWKEARGSEIALGVSDRKPISHSPFLALAKLK